jgi:signal transduction histidine kinase
VSVSAPGAGPTRQHIAPSDPELRARDQRLEALKAVVGRLAHDFNNALVPILGYISLAKEDLEPGSGASNFVSAAENGARKTERHLDTILLAVYPHRKFKAVPTSLNELIQSEVESWKRTLPSEPKIEFSLGLISCVRDLDSFQWQTLIQHLLRNACKALPKGGRVQVSLVRRALDESGAAEIGVKPGPFCVMTCQDDGCGMSGETLDRCCEPFFTTQPKNKAEGLGLTIVHSIARLHGGQLRVRSEEGGGTAVEVWSPLD